VQYCEQGAIYAETHHSQCSTYATRIPLSWVSLLLFLQNGWSATASTGQKPTVNVLKGNLLERQFTAA
jgi:hypothetical protein